MGERLETIVLDILELLLEAAYSREKTMVLSKANIKLDKARYYVRLCMDLKLIDFKKYQVTSKLINEVGVQLGGWLRQQKGRG